MSTAAKSMNDILKDILNLEFKSNKKEMLSAFKSLPIGRVDLANIGNQNLIFQHFKSRSKINISVLAFCYFLISGEYKRAESEIDEPDGGFTKSFILTELEKMLHQALKEYNPKDSNCPIAEYGTQNPVCLVYQDRTESKKIYEKSYASKNFISERKICPITKKTVIAIKPSNKYQPLWCSAIILGYLISELSHDQPLRFIYRFVAHNKNIALWLSGWAVMYAAVFDNENMMRALYHKKLRIDQCHKEGPSFSASPLYIAASKGNLNTLKYLLTHGADANIDEFDTFGNTALAIAAFNGHLDVVRELISHCAKVNLRMQKGNWKDKSPLYLAILNGRKEIIDLLVDNGARLTPAESILALTENNFHAKRNLLWFSKRMKYLTKLTEDVIKLFFEKMPAMQLLSLTNDGRQMLFARIFKTLHFSLKANFRAESREKLVTELANSDLTSESIKAIVAKITSPTLAPAKQQKLITDFFTASSAEKRKADTQAAEDPNKRPRAEEKPASKFWAVVI